MWKLARVAEIRLTWVDHGKTSWQLSGNLTAAAVNWGFVNSECEENFSSNVKRGMSGRLVKIRKWIIHVSRVRNKLQSQHGDIYWQLFNTRRQVSGLRFMLRVWLTYSVYQDEDLLSEWIGRSVFIHPSCERPTSAKKKIRWAGVTIRNKMTWYSTCCKIYFLCVWNYYKCPSYSFHLQVVRSCSTITSVHL